MNIEDRVEAVLRERGRGLVEPAAVQPGGYVVERVDESTARVRVAGLAKRVWILDETLQSCGELLAAAGFRVEQAEDVLGVHLRVSAET